MLHWLKKKYSWLAICISQNNNNVTTSSVLSNIQYFTNNIIWTNKNKNKTNIFMVKVKNFKGEFCLFVIYRIIVHWFLFCEVSTNR